MTVTMAGAPARTGIDPRGPRVAAGLSAVVLAAVLLLPAGPATFLTALQLVLFGVGALRGAQATPQAWVFRTWIRPRLAAPTELEDPAPPRFAQVVGLVFASVALIAFLLGMTTVGQVAIGLALVAALLNAALGFCLGCELYLLLKRTRPRRLTSSRNLEIRNTR